MPPPPYQPVVLSDGTAAMTLPIGGMPIAAATTIYESEHACCWPADDCQVQECTSAVSLANCAAGGGNAVYGRTCGDFDSQCTYPRCIYEPGGMNPECCDYPVGVGPHLPGHPAPIDWDLVPDGEPVTCAHVTCPENEPDPLPTECEACPELDPMPSVVIVSGINTQCCINVECDPPPEGDGCLAANAKCEALDRIAGGIHVLVPREGAAGTGCNYRVNKRLTFDGSPWGQGTTILQVEVQVGFSQDGGQVRGSVMYFEAGGGVGWHGAGTVDLDECGGFVIELDEGQWETPTTTTEGCDQIPETMTRARACPGCQIGVAI